MTIAELAETNRGNIENFFVGIARTPDIDSFDAHLHTSLQSSINLNHTAFVGSIRSGRYLSAYEFHGNDKTALQDHFGPKYPYRPNFDALFEDGERLKYFALNSGNMGMPSLWGRYCIVLGLDYFSGESTAILRQNSLAKMADGTHYYFNGTAPDIGRIGDEIGPLHHAREQCIIKKQHAVDGCTKAQYPDLVCDSTVAEGDFRSSDYIELLTSQDCILDNNYIVRMRKIEVNWFFAITFDSYSDGELKDNKKPTDREIDEFIDLTEEHPFRREFIDNVQIISL